MPLLNYLTYSAGLAPGDDCEAQRRCLKFLNDTIEAMETDGADETNTQFVLFRSVRDLIEPWTGSWLWANTTKFWNLWDKNRHGIIAFRLGTRDDKEVMEKVAELEEGRFYND